MVRPAAFGFNSETAGSNAFQKEIRLSNLEILMRAQEEFDFAVHLLGRAGVLVYVIEDSVLPEKPDAVFPNNWISFHENGELVLYPMEAPNRRCERRLELVLELQKKFHFDKIFDLTHFEERNLFLEGTGSVVFDHEFKTAYAALSSRTSAVVLKELCSHLNYQPVVFNANDVNGIPIYHTNVVMCMGPDFAVLCVEAITDSKERDAVLLSLRNAGKTVLEISRRQMEMFSGNMLVLRNVSDELVIVLSRTAFKSLEKHQKDFLSAKGQLVILPIEVIEAVGGGSARCMLAEVC